MSNRTIVEFNHDMALHIEEQPEAFVDHLLNALRSGDRNVWEQLRYYGVRYGVAGHHSEIRYCGTAHDHNSPDTKVTFP